MTSPSPRKTQSRSSMFTISLILGLLLIPLSAVAATALISSDGESDSDDAGVIVVEVPETTVATTATTEAETVFVAEPPTATRADLEAACGPEGLELVERETAGTITDLEQAALDSLRQICAEEGLELAGPPAPPPVVRTVKVVDTSTAATTGDTVSDDAAVSGSDDHDDDHDDDDHDDDHDDHDDDHDDDDDEDNPNEEDDD